MTTKDNDPGWIFKTQDGTEFTFESCMTYPVVKTPIPDTVRSESEDGYITTRPRNTRRRFTFELQFPFMSLEDGVKFEDLDLIVTGTETFKWYNILEDKIYIVRFPQDTRPNYTYETFNYVSIKFSLEEF